MATAQTIGKGVIPAALGAWDAYTRYERNAIVSYGGGVWIAKEKSTGMTPSASSPYWMALGTAQSGDWNVNDASSPAYIANRPAYFTQEYGENALFANVSLSPLSGGEEVAFTADSLMEDGVSYTLVCDLGQITLAAQTETIYYTSTLSQEVVYVGDPYLAYREGDTSRYEYGFCLIDGFFYLTDESLFRASLDLPPSLVLDESSISCYYYGKLPNVTMPQALLPSMIEGVNRVLIVPVASISDALKIDFSQYEAGDLILVASPLQE